ncbi:hypothetical protein T459_19971 [Capsicum annuum]|uniref:Uncharacterized protein n=1 Tax=Capsicum annuum TaxID=4072 RepID=A0A2G2Z399_CAPAN|nr:hypothetical protein T459_19971 [Capsicum annuum]
MGSRCLILLEGLNLIVLDSLTWIEMDVKDTQYIMCLANEWGTESNMDPAGLGPLANIQCWHLKSRVGPGGVVPSKRLGHDLVGVEQSPEKLVLLELCVLDLSSPGMPRSKICSTSQARVTRSADITGNIGYTPTSTSKLKWNGNTAISTKKLQEIKEKKRKKNVESSSNNSSKKTLIQSSRCPGNCSHVDYFKHCFKLDQLT